MIDFDDLEELDPISKNRKRGWSLDAAVQLIEKREKETSVEQLIDDAEKVYQYLLAIKPSKVLKLVPNNTNKIKESRADLPFDKAVDKFAELYYKLDKSGSDAVIRYMNRLISEKKQLKWHL